MLHSRKTPSKKYTVYIYNNKNDNNDNDNNDNNDNKNDHNNNDTNDNNNNDNNNSNNSNNDNNDHNNNDDNDNNNDTNNNSNNDNIDKNKNNNNNNNDNNNNIYMYNITYIYIYINHPNYSMGMVLIHGDFRRCTRRKWPKCRGGACFFFSVGRRWNFLNGYSIWYIYNI